jgi:hypothetical protein
MKFITHAHRQGDIILKEERYSAIYKEITDVISSITDQDVITKHETKYGQKMSLSYAINDLLRERFGAKGWLREAPIFQDKGYQSNKWRLDFAKDSISIEVGFNHGEAIAWNLLKPVLASELNHIDKAIQTKVGVVICATKNLKKGGAFDGAVGEYEKILRYLIPLNNILSVPMMIIGLEAPETFGVEKFKLNNKNVGKIVRK